MNSWSTFSLKWKLLQDTKDKFVRKTREESSSLFTTAIFAKEENQMMIAYQFKCFTAPFLKGINWNINYKICLNAAKQEWKITLLKRPHKCYTHMILLSFDLVVLSKWILDGQWEAIQVLCKRSIQLLSTYP